MIIIILDNGKELFLLLHGGGMSGWRTVPPFLCFWLIILGFLIPGFDPALGSDGRALLANTMWPFRGWAIGWHLHIFQHFAALLRYPNRLDRLLHFLLYANGTVSVLASSFLLPVASDDRLVRIDPIGPETSQFPMRTPLPVHALPF